MGDSDLANGEECLTFMSDPVVAQAGFDAAWDLLTRWRHGDRVRALAYISFLGPDVFGLPEVMYALVAAEERAHREAGEPLAANGVEWLHAVLPHNADVYFLLADLFTSDDVDMQVSPADRTAAYPYLSSPEKSDELGRFGHFRVLREIGQGGMGVVFEVEVANSILNDSHALKVLQATRTTPEARLRFVREARAMKEIAHPNIVGIHNAAAKDGITYIEMEYVYGPTLDALIRYHFGNPVPLPLATDLIRQAANGLAAAHDHRSRIAHRDVKPGNILMQWMPDGDFYPFCWRVRVCDFGLAAEADQTSLTEEGAVVGTLAYLAPEQLSPRGRSLDARMSDIFALGSIAYELVTGHHPFKVDSSAATQANIERCQPMSPRQANSETPKSLERMILAMLDRVPSNRPSAREVAAGFSELLGSSETRTSFSSNEPTPVFKPLTLRLEVTVWKKEDLTRGLPIDDPTALPLRTGDYVRLDARPISTSCISKPGGMWFRITRGRSTNGVCAARNRK
jgi:serine/threonine protein kinase